jgi:hypothetical protein
MCDSDGGSVVAWTRRRRVDEETLLSGGAAGVPVDSDAVGAC